MENPSRGLLQEAEAHHGPRVPPVTGGRTALRGLLGALQWPATQTSPHLQSAVSLMAGCVTAATTKPLESANKALRYAKANADVGLDFRHLGPREDMTFVAFSDASLAAVLTWQVREAFSCSWSTRMWPRGRRATTTSWTGGHGSWRGLQDPL